MSSFPFQRRYALTRRAFFFVDERGRLGGLGPESVSGVLSGLHEKGKTVFFPLAYTNRDGTLECDESATVVDAGRKLRRVSVEKCGTRCMISLLPL